MKILGSIILLVFLWGCSTELPTEIKTDSEQIKIIINGKVTKWTVSPEINPDRLRVYCETNQNEVLVQTDLDTIKYNLAEYDTLCFDVILKGSDTARTEIIGVKSLPDTYSVEEKVSGFSRFWSEMKYNFVNMDRMNFNIDSLYDAFLPQIIASENDYEYYRLMKKFTALFTDGHTEVYTSSQFYIFSDYIPMSLREFDQRIYITSIRKVPYLDSTWLGAELVEIDGIPAKEYMETEIFPYISASTQQHLWMQGIYKLQSGLKTIPFRTKIKKTDGVFEELELQRNGEATRTPEDEFWGPKLVYDYNIVSLKHLENDIALISFNRFNPEEKAIQEFDKIVKELGDPKGIIIDLRYNGGGSTGVGWHLQKHLTRGDQFLNYGWETRINNGAHRANGNWIEEYEDVFLNRAVEYNEPEVVKNHDSIPRFEVPVLILIGPYTFSAAEDFLVNLYEVPGRPLLIGEETGGSTGSPLLVYGLPGGAYARICTRRICYPYSGNKFVNQGVKPDIQVRKTVEDYFNQRDVVLEKAQEVLVESL